MARFASSHHERGLALWAALVLTLAGGCGGDTGTSPVAGGSEQPITITPQQARLSPGARQRFAVSVTDAGGVSRPAGSVRWRSSAPAVLGVDQSGLATARAKGRATITAELAQGTATTTADVCEGDDCGPIGPVMFPSPVEGPSPVPAPTGPPPPDPRRPPEIVGVEPFEDDVLDPYQPACDGCGGPDFFFFAVRAQVRFPGEETFATGRMWIDGTEVPVRVTLETPVPVMFVQGYVAHDVFDHPLDAGLHEVTVEVTSREGRAVRYSWRFTFTEPSGRR
jgi:hypothetical protein